MYLQPTRGGGTPRLHLTNKRLYFYFSYFTSLLLTPSDLKRIMRRFNWCNSKRELCSTFHLIFHLSPTRGSLLKDRHKVRWVYPGGGKTALILYLRRLDNKHDQEDKNAETY